MESDLEELHDSEQRWAAKHKRAIEQVLHGLCFFAGASSLDLVSPFLFSLTDRAAADEADPGERSK